jgi:ABC-2 type transport system ATP-binding protein
VIRVDHVRHWFGSLEVIRDLTMHVPAGEIFGFIGPNGAGKTTTIRMMATLLEPDDGRVMVDGIDVVEHPAEVRKILGFMPDGFGVYDRITVEEYLEFFAAAHGIALGARARTVAAVMELTDLAPLRERLVASMSKGMRQRLGIARMLLHDPKVLILDEPANGLDPRARIEMRALIEELRGLGKTILLSSHILTELAGMCTSVAILEKGRLVAGGSVDAIGKTLRPERAVKLRLLAAPADVESTIAKGPAVLGVEREPDGSYRVQYRGTDEQLADLIDHCVQSGLRVIRVEPDQNDLERIFLELTKGELQ